MCTLTWVKQDSSYEIFFNRDELLTRQEEIPPSLHKKDRVQFLAPVDPQGQGTWVGVNDRGVTLCLANMYPSRRIEGKHYKSRGQLLWSLLANPSLRDVIDQLKGQDLKEFLEFRIVGFSLREKICILQFNEGELKINTDAEDCYPITSSSFQSQVVQDGREKHFEEIVGRSRKLTAEILDNYQKSTYPTLSAYSVCMKRDNACTKSYSRIKVDEKEIIFTYQPYPWKEPKSELSVLNLKVTSLA